ncbi:MAG: hypothetical protein JNL10_02280 [Verrucomicrobiales bacterium]|nr:hypothetical protein [Verrucomicrobiales bacterium]
MNDRLKVIRAKFLETEGHYLTAWERHPRNTAWIWIIIAIPLVIGLLNLPGIIKDQKAGRNEWWAALIPVLLISILVWFYMSPSGQRRSIRKSLKKVLRSPPVEAWFEFADAGFLATGRDGRNSFHPWVAVPKAIECSDGVLIYIDDTNQAFFWLPQTAFSSPDDYSALKQLLIAKVRNVGRRGR